VTEPTVLFLLGVTQRCGTNFLFDLLQRHPDIDTYNTYPPIGEDYIFQRIGPLVEFASSITGLWHNAAKFKPPQELFPQVRSSLELLILATLGSGRTCEKLIIAVMENRRTDEGRISSFGTRT
jgi:hypothetical protein